MLIPGSVLLSHPLFQLFLNCSWRVSLSPPQTRRGTEKLMKLCASQEFRLLRWRPLGLNSKFTSHTLVCLLHLRPRIPSPRVGAQTNFPASASLLVQYLMQFIKFQGPSRTPDVSMASFLCFPKTAITVSLLTEVLLPSPCLKLFWLRFQASFCNGFVQ